VVADSDTEWRGRVEGAEPGKLHNKCRLYPLFYLLTVNRIYRETAGIPSNALHAMHVFSDNGILRTNTFYQQLKMTVACS